MDYKKILQILKNKIDNYLLVHLDKALDRPNIKNGLIEKTRHEIYKSGDYIHDVLGSTNSRELKKDGNFEQFTPVGEQQNIGFEKMWCVSENGTCNPIEANFNYFINLVNSDEADEETQELVKIFRHFNLIKDNRCLLSTEYVAVGSGTTRRGNSMNKPADFIRKNGLIPKGEYPKYATWNELYSPSGGTYINGNKMPLRLLEQGKRLCEYVDFTYEWVSARNMDSVMKKGVLGTSCFAWHYPNANGIYQRVNLQANHSVYKYKKSDNTFKTIGDSYNPFTKNLALDYDLGYGLLISFGVKKKLPNERKILLEEGREYVMRSEVKAGGRGEIYRIAENGLIYVSPKEWNDMAVEEKTVERKIKFITEKYFLDIK